MRPHFFEDSKSPMKTVRIENIKGKELPAAWQQAAEVGADELVDIIISPPGRQQARKMLEEVFAKPVAGPFAEMTDEEIMAVVNREIRYYRKEIRGKAAEEAEWEALVQTPQSQRFLDMMVAKLRQDEATGDVFEFDPGDTK